MMLEISIIPIHDGDIHITWRNDIGTVGSQYD